MKHRLQTARPWLAVAAGLLVASLGIGRGAVSAQASQTASTNVIQWGSCAAPPDGIPDAGQQCATISVPKDYHYPNGPKISVAISRVPAADPSKRRGVLLSNPGGPGGAGIDMPRVLTVLLPQNVKDEYDLIGFDPRGVGQSTPVTCGLTSDQATQAYAPLTQNHSFASTTSFMQSVANGCASHSGDLLPYITTANTARDMDLIRQSLGEQKISYLGYSYGTYLGAVYSSLFPTQTDRIVLDSSVNPNHVWQQAFQDWGPAGDARFADFAKYAASNDGTYHLGSTPAQIDQLYFQLIHKTAQHPYTVPVGTKNGLVPDGTVLNDTLFREFAFSGLYADASFPAMAQLFQLVKDAPTAAATTHTTITPSAASTTPADNEAASGLAIACDDASWPTQPLVYKAELDANIAKAPMFGELGANIWPCAFWQNKPLSPPVPISSNGPANNIMIVQDTRDPATPYTGALQMRQALGSRARMVSVDQGGHAVYELKPNVCANDTVTNYLADGTFPQSDTFCPANPAAPNTYAADSSSRTAAIQQLYSAMRP
jgi:pimeloyl-ACP methyl ester carboxylesterase